MDVLPAGEQQGVDGIEQLGDFIRLLSVWQGQGQGAGVAEGVDVIGFEDQTRRAVTGRRVLVITS